MKAAAALLSLSLLNGLLAGAACAQAPDTERWARVILVRGPVSVESPSGPRLIARGDYLRAGDTLVTGSDALVQLRAWDGTQVQLMQDSRLLLSAATPPGGGGPQAGSNHYRLDQGGLRMVSGSAVTSVDTPLGHLRADGTFECLQEHELNCAVSAGSLQIHNSQGSLRLGTGGQFDYALVASSASAPLGLLSIPPPLDAGAGAVLNSPHPVPSAGTPAGRLPGAAAFPEPAPIVVQPRRRQERAD